MTAAKKKAPAKAVGGKSFLAAMAQGAMAEEVDIPGWGKIYAHAISARTGRRLSEACALPPEQAGAEPGMDGERYVNMLIVASFRDGEGNPLFAEGDHASLPDLPGHVLTKLQAAALKANGMDLAAQADAAGKA